MKKVAIFPGSFDPITIGHINIIERGSYIFDKIIVAIGINTSKKYMFPIEKRKEWIELATQKFTNVEVEIYEGLTYKYCLEKEANYILRGIRNPSDFEFEKSIAHFNQDLSKNKIDTVFLLTTPDYSFISSSNVREIILNKGDFSNYVPKEIVSNILNLQS
ncbi:MAG: pantetheine-phosphate adenylyltransferase [Solirubrobacteraceae bacterium]